MICKSVLENHDGEILLLGDFLQIAGYAVRRPGSRHRAAEHAHGGLEEALGAPAVRPGGADQEGSPDPGASARGDWLQGRGPRHMGLGRGCVLLRSLPWLTGR